MIQTIDVPDDQRLDVGSAMHEMAAELFPICRSITGEGVRETLGAERHVPIVTAENPLRHPRFRLDDSPGMEHSRCVHQELTWRARRRFPALQPSRDELQRPVHTTLPPSEQLSRICSRLTSIRRGSRTARPTIRRTGVSV